MNEKTNDSNYTSADGEGLETEEWKILGNLVDF